MKDLAYSLFEGIRKYLHHTPYDIVSFSRLPDQEEYIVRIRPKDSLEKKTRKPSLDGIYLPNGKLNVPYLMKNADLLFEAGDLHSARKIYKTLLQSGECTATLLSRLEKCNEVDSFVLETGASNRDKISFTASHSEKSH